MKACCCRSWVKMTHSLSVYSRWICHGNKILKFCNRMSSKTASSSEKSNTDQNTWEWMLPEGYNTGINVYNQLARKTVPLILLNKQLATWYMCGPTVYDSAHIGHACCYIKFDIIRRILEKFFNIDVIMAMGITNIDDKIIQRSKELNVSIEHMTQQYEQEFFQDLGKLGMLPPSMIVRVTDHISQMIAFCEKIINNKMAYTTPEGSVYFDQSKVDYHGKLSGQTPSDDDDETIKNLDPHKRDPKDFALWKGVKPGEPWWNAPWGKGRPGWHIECSAMASHIFGSNLDIHTGGKDLLFPHHENEELQSEAYHGTSQWANYWLHTGHLHLKDDEKMSKSLKNTITIKEFLKENSANDFRIFCMQSLYQNDVEYSDTSLDKAKATYIKLQSFLSDAEAYIDGHLTCGPFDEPNLMKSLEETRATIQDELANNFNTAEALDTILKLVTEVTKGLQSKQQASNVPRSPGAVASCSSFIINVLELFGVNFTSKKKLIISNESTSMLVRVMDAVVKFRGNVRLYALTMGSTAQPQYKMHQLPSSDGDQAPEESLPLSPEQPPPDKGDMLWTSQQILTSKEKAKLNRMEREPLIQACDDLRKDLFISGIQIKDKGKESSWSVLEDRSLEGKRSSLASHDAFDPLYKPQR